MEVIDIFRKWDLDAVVIGRVRDGQNMRVIHEGETVADIPVSALNPLAADTTLGIGGGAKAARSPGFKVRCRPPGTEHRLGRLQSGLHSSSSALGGEQGNLLRRARVREQDLRDSRHSE